MSLLELTPPEKAEGKLAELYSQVEQYFGMVPDNVRMFGVSPAILENQLDSMEYYIGHPALSMKLLAGIRLMCAQSMASPYCQGFNAEMLRKQGVTVEELAAMKADPAKAPLSDKERAMLLVALKAAKEPHSVTAEDLDALRSMGWSDRDIFDAVAHAARSVAANIIFDTFKLGGSCG